MRPARRCTRRPHYIDEGQRILEEKGIQFLIASRSVSGEGKLIVVFDGVCNFCNWWTRFIIERDRHRQFQFASAQSEKGTEILIAHRLPYQNLETMVLIDGPRHYEKSDAVLQILKHLGGLWRASQIFVFVPKRLRDAWYTAFARRRYRWFGKSDECLVPGLKWRDRFIS
jgi:predicted DCC family thiol-disulfide oxidoreductase YuxK